MQMASLICLKVSILNFCTGNEFVAGLQIVYNATHPIFHKDDKGVSEKTCSPDLYLLSFQISLFTYLRTVWFLELLVFSPYTCVMVSQVEVSD